MTTREYKKKLNEYRKSIRETAKCVAFKEVTPQPDEKLVFGDLQNEKWSMTANPASISLTLTTKDLPSRRALSPAPQPQPCSKDGETINENSIMYEPVGRYIDWRSDHTMLASQPWCCIGDLMAFCDKYEFKAVSASDSKTHATIVSEVKALLSGNAPFDVRKRFPSHIRSPENLMVCIGRCPSVEYHLGKVISSFRKPLETLSPDKQRMARQNFHLAVRELRLDISARVTAIRLFDQKVFERDFRLTWEDTKE